MIFIVLIIMVVFVVGLIFMVQSQLKKLDELNEGLEVNSSSMQNAQDFLPFKEIKDNMIDMGSDNYRTIIEVSSTNYGLKTEKEQQIIEANFQRFLNSLQFPITIYVQTKVIDNSKMLETLEIELIQTIEENPGFAQYANDYFQGMLELHDRIGNNKQKKKYIIIEYNDVKELTHLSPEEKYEEAQKEIMLRTTMIIDNIQAIGLKAHILGTADLIELIYSVFHKDDYRSFEQIIEKEVIDVDGETRTVAEFLELIVQAEGKNLLREVSTHEKVDMILYQAQMNMRDEVFIKNLTEKEKKLYSAFINSLTEMREALGNETDGGVR